MQMPAGLLEEMHGVLKNEAREQRRAEAKARATRGRR
jgi:hypothetical protein